MRNMAEEKIEWPKKTREMQNHHMDSTIWNDFKFRDDDIIISTYAKAGTTWLQQILAQLLFKGQEGLEVAEMSPWLDLRVPPKDEKLPAMEAQEHRRFFKTHLPVDALVFSPQAKYLYIGRDGRDIVWSLYNHHASANEEWYKMLNDTPGRVGPPIGKPPASIRQYFHDWLDKDGYPVWPCWENIKSWWDIRHLPNVLLLHFEALKKDMPGQISRIAEYLAITIDETKWDAILEHCKFDYMKQHATKSVPMGGIWLDGGSRAFIYKGKNGRWRDTLTAEESQKYERMAKEQLGEPCAHWLSTGELLN